MSVVYLSCLLKKMIQFHFYVLPKLWLIFCCHQQKIHKSTIFNILITITLEVKITIRQANPFFYLLFELLSVGLFHLCISKDLPNSISSVPHLHYVAIPKDLQNSVSNVPHLHYVLIQKIFKTQFQVSPICTMF